MVKKPKTQGPWTEPVLVKPGKGIIDTCPLWDEDGKVYLVHAYAGSRAGLKSVITICELNKEATKAITPHALSSTVTKHTRRVKARSFIKGTAIIISSIRQAVCQPVGR